VNGFSGISDDIKILQEKVNGFSGISDAQRGVNEILQSGLDEHAKKINQLGMAVCFGTVGMAMKQIVKSVSV